MSISISALIFMCVFGGAMPGVFMRIAAPDHRLSAESKDVLKLGAGLIGTTTGPVLGLLECESDRGGFGQPTV
ncbi:MAG TPA: hypothetical protein VMV94_04420 [Phycisphaerae bacterium]|nr:hypothetical protein [Phycisphaerae bacterium]